MAAASLFKPSLHPNPSLSLPLLSSSHSSSFNLPFKPSPFKTLTLTLAPIRSSHNPTPKPTRTLISSVVKPAVIALTAAAAAAVFLSRHPRPALAYVSPPAATQSETLADDLTEKALESRLKSNAADVSALRSLLELKVKSQKLCEAIEVADRLIALEPGENDLSLLKAHLQSYAGEIEAAKVGFEEIVAKNPYLVEAYHGLVMMASQSGSEGELSEVLKRVKDAMVMCKKENRKGELKDFKLLIAQVWVMEGRYKEALKIYEELVKEEPKDFRPYLCQGIIYTLLRKKDVAEKHFEKYRQLVPQGHPYAQFFDHNMDMMKGFSTME